MPQAEQLIVYRPEPTALLFHNSEAFVRGLMGPIGSGKSSACCVELWDRACKQTPHEGIRRTRFAVVRNTYPQLITTSMNTWKEWVPESVCPITMASPIHGDTKKVTKQGLPLPDGTFIDMEIYFLALDQENDVSKLKSLELTGLWINEASEVVQGVLKMGVGRCDRYPPKRLGGPTWSGVIMDTNPPDEESWWYQLCEIEKPSTYEFFKQPPAILQVPTKDKSKPMYVENMGQGSYQPAENVKHHNSGYEYWMRQIPGADPEWIKVFLMGMYGSLMEGKAVYDNEYIDSVHFTEEEMTIYRGLPIIVGWDFGLSPAAVLCQIAPNGQFRVIDELVSEDMGIRRFASDFFKPHVRNNYPGIPLINICDPAGTQRSETDETSCIDILHQEGIVVSMAPTNRFLARREAVAYYLNRMIAGAPGLLVGPKCPMVRKGFQGSYKYRTLRVQTGRKFSDEPEKNKYSHPHDAVQYAALNAQRGGSGAQANSTQGNTQALPEEATPSAGWD